MLFAVFGYVGVITLSYIDNTINKTLRCYLMSCLAFYLFVL